MIVVDHGLRGRLERLLDRPEPRPPTTPARLLRTIADTLDRWESARTDRPLALPWSGGAGEPEAVGPLVLTVAGVSRGGSWKTPFALSLVEELTGRGLRCGLAMRGYRARGPVAARLVADDATARAAGDEAFAAFLRLAALRQEGRARVAVGADFAAGVALLARGTIDKETDLTRGAAPPRLDVIVVDGCRRRPPRAHGLAFVTYDAGAPARPSPGLPAGFGLAVSPGERIWVPVRDGVAAGRESPEDPAEAAVQLVFATGSTVLPLDEARRRAGPRAIVVTTHARPERFIHALEARGFAPLAHLRLSDHATEDEVAVGLDALERRLGGRLGTLLLADKALLATSRLRPELPRLIARCRLRLGDDVLAPVLARVNVKRAAAGGVCRPS
jgi:hypothetical protein